MARQTAVQKKAAEAATKQTEELKDQQQVIESEQESQPETVPEGMHKVTLRGVRVHTKLERRCRAGLVFTREPTLIEGEALDAVDLAALETDPYLHVEYIAE